MICGSSVPVNSNVQRSCLFSVYADDHCLVVNVLERYQLNVLKKKKSERAWFKEYPILPAPERPWLSSLFPQPEQLDPGEPLEDNLLSVRKPAVGRTHSLPNDSYMFLPLQPFGHTEPGPAQLLAQTQGPQHILDARRAQSGSVTCS